MPYPGYDWKVHSVDAAGLDVGTTTNPYVVTIGAPAGATLLWAEINLTTSGDKTIVTATAAKIIRVVNITFTTDTATTVAFKSNAGNIKIHAMPFATNGGMDVKRSPDGWFVDTNAGEAFIINSSAVANLNGCINYFLM